MKNPVLDQIHRHGSIRHYKSDPIPHSTIETIVAAAQRAPTSSNMQAFSVIVVSDPAKRERLYELCGNQKHIRQAPVFMVWCADLARLDRACAMRGYEQESGYAESFLVAAVDAALAAQNATLAAESMGLGTCYIGGIRNHPLQVIELLEMPALVFPITGMTIGVPAVETKIRPRLPLKSVLMWEKYDRAYEDAGLREYDHAMLETGIYDGRQVAVPGRQGQLEAYGWLEHTARRVSQAVRTHLRDALEKQGFLLK